MGVPTFKRQIGETGWPEAEKNQKDSHMVVTEGRVKFKRVGGEGLVAYGDE